MAAHFDPPPCHFPLVHRIQAAPRRSSSNVTMDSSDSDYVFDIAVNDTSSVMGVSLSTHVIKLYSPCTGQHLGDCCGHSDTISRLAFAENVSPNFLCSSSTDGTLRAWDTRSRTQVGVLRPDSSMRDVWSFSSGGSSGNLFVAAVDAQLVFWDWRTKRQLLCLEELHTEAVTQVDFFPNERDKVASSSVDGLMCTVDMKGQKREDDHLESVMNVGTSVAKFGFYGESYGKLWCLTHIETLSIWQVESAVLQVDLGDLRAKLTSKWPPCSVSYLIDCHYSPFLDRLWVVGGTQRGSTGFFPISCVPSTDVCNDNVGPATVILDGGHEDVVRSVWTPRNSTVGFADEAGLLLWSGGEDGRLCSWSDHRNYPAGHSNLLTMKKGKRGKDQIGPY